MVPIKVGARFNCPRANGRAIEKRNSPTFRLRGLLVEFSDRPLSFCHTGAPIQQRFSKIGIEYDKNPTKEESGGLEVLQEFEQLPAELVQIDSVFVVDGMLEIGTHDL